MILRSVLSTLALLTFTAAPVLGVGVSAGVGEGGSASGTSSNLRVTPGQAVTAPTAGTHTDCTASLRSFRNRNTIQPSERRRALRACRNEAAREDWAARSH